MSTQSIAVSAGKLHLEMRVPNYGAQMKQRTHRGTRTIQTEKVTHSIVAACCTTGQRKAYEQSNLRMIFVTFCLSCLRCGEDY